MRQAISGAGGVEVSTEGDSFFVIFADALSGASAAVEAQRLLAAERWPQDEVLAVRMGLHAGEVALSEGEYVGVELHRAARIASTAHGGQIVVSSSFRNAIGSDLPDGTTLSDLGEHRLKDFDEAVHLYQIDISGLRTEFPPLTSLSARFEIMPPELSTFVGRGDEVAAVSDLLTSSRLLTMTGPGGTGKTRLALQAARHCQESYAQGVAFVPLAPITDAGLVAATIRGALGFSEEPGESSIDTLTSKLKHHEMLLILDNFEQVMPAADSVSSLLGGTERLTLLVTSRASLHVDGEQEFSVPPLSVPTPGDVIDIDEVGSSEAVSLFVDRARKARPGFELDEGNARAIALICQRLDGLPLAIELAASRIKLLSPDQLLARLSKRMDILGTGGGAITDRRRTLRGTIDWSHDLLTPEEQTTFRRLSIFVGGATLDAVEAVVPNADASVEGEPQDVFTSLGQLVDHSLVRSVEDGGDPRFLMLQTIREYGQERLVEANETETLGEAHARHYLGRASELAPSFTSEAAALDAVEADHDNIRAALRWMVDHDHTQEALAAVADLWRFWHMRGHLREGLGVSESVLAMPGADESTEPSAGALYARASLLYWKGDSTEALAGYQASLVAARAATAPAREAEAQFALAYAYLIVNDWEAARRAAAAAETLYEELDDKLGAANSRFAEAYVATLSGDYEKGARGFRGVIKEVEATGDQFWLLNSKVVLAWTLTRLNQLDEARTILLENLDGAVELGDRSSENMAIDGLATIAALEQDTNRSLRLAGASHAITDEMGGKAPGELVISLDPVEVSRDAGADEATIEQLLAEGRALSRDAARALARES